MNTQDSLLVKHAGICDYRQVFAAMQEHNRTRKLPDADELWCLQHTPVYTLGMAGKPEHILRPDNIAIIKTDRGGQVTYHGPGQLIVYLLVDLKKRGLTVKRYVNLLEQAIIDMCRELKIYAQRRAGAPGVYVTEKKIASLGIRIKQGYSYHGLALNVDMDLHPFTNINPCGYPGLAVTQLADEGAKLDTTQAFRRLLPHLLKQLGYTGYTEQHVKNFMKAEDCHAL